MPLLAEVYQGSLQDVEKIEAELKQVKEENKALRQEVMKMSKVKGFSSGLVYESDSRTKFYTGLPVYGVFTALVTYLRPKAENLREWSGERETAPSSSNRRGRRPFSDISIEDQLFAVLVHLRLDLYGQDISHRMGISEGVFSKLFPTWVIVLSKELPLLFPCQGKIV